MKNRLRQEILNELKFLLNEGGGYLGQALDYAFGDKLNKPASSPVQSGATNIEGYPGDVFATSDNASKNQMDADQACIKQGYDGAKFVQGSGQIANNIGRYKCIKAPVPSPVPSPDPASKLSCARCKGVGKGCKGAAVSEVQKKLLDLGHKIAIEELAGYAFETDTEAAVKAFQSSKKLKQDGIVGRQTCLAMGLIRKPVARAARTGNAGTGSSNVNLQGGLGGPVQPSTVDLRVKKCTDGSDAPDNDVLKCPGAAEAVARNASSTLEEKKIREAGVLFNKLIKRL